MASELPNSAIAHSSSAGALACSSLANSATSGSALTPISALHLAAHGHEGVECRRGAEIFVVAGGNQYQKIALRRYAEVISVQRLQAVTERVDSGFDRLAAPVGALRGKTNRAQE